MLNCEKSNVFLCLVFKTRHNEVTPGLSKNHILMAANNPCDVREPGVTC